MKVGWVVCTTLVCAMDGPCLMEWNGTECWYIWRVVLVASYPEMAPWLPAGRGTFRTVRRKAELLAFDMPKAVWDCIAILCNLVSSFLLAC